MAVGLYYWHQCGYSNSAMEEDGRGCRETRNDGCVVPRPMYLLMSVWIGYLSDWDGILKLSFRHCQWHGPPSEGIHEGTGSICFLSIPSNSKMSQ